MQGARIACEVCAFHAKHLHLKTMPLVEQIVRPLDLLCRTLRTNQLAERIAPSIPQHSKLANKPRRGLTICYSVSSQAPEPAELMRK